MNINIWNDHIFELRIKDRNIWRLSQWRYFILRGWKKKPEKFQALTGIETMTSAIPVQRSHQLSYQANWELVDWEFVFIP